MRPGEKRKQRAQNQASRLLRPLKSAKLDCIIQCGLGDWAEGPVLLDMFPNLAYMAVDPVHRYCHEAWAAGFRGPIIQGLLYNTTGITKQLYDWRTRTSIHDEKSHGLGTIDACTLTLDDAVQYVNFTKGNTLLWMDVEGAELEILKGATETLKSVVAIISELKVGAKFPAWPTKEETIKEIEALGYTLVKEVRANGLFIKAAAPE